MSKSRRTKQSFLTVCLPYCLQRTSDGHWVALNRAMKPVGIQGSNWYLNESTLALRFTNFSPAIEQMLRARSSRKDQIFLYTSVSDPARGADLLQEYLAKLALLAPLTIVAQ